MDKRLPVVPVVPCCYWLLVLVYVLAPGPNIPPALALALLGKGFGAGLVFQNRDGVVVLLWMVIVPVVLCCWLLVLVLVFRPSSNIPPAMALALLGRGLVLPNRDGVVLL